MGEPIIDELSAMAGGGAGETPAVDSADIVDGQAAEQLPAAPDQPKDSAPDKPQPDKAAKQEKADTGTEEKGQAQAAQKEWENFGTDLPEWADKALVDSFKKFAQKEGFTAAQAAKAAKWQMDTIEKAREQMVKSGLKQLQKDWGQDYAANLAKIKGFIDTIAKSSGLDIMKALNDSGAALNTDLIKALLVMADKIGEDTASGQPATAPETETVEQGLRNALNEQKRKNYS